MSCSSCICRNCLYWWSGRCPYGRCYDDHRTQADPYDQAYPGQPPRTGWSDWKTDQAHWCRGGALYPAHQCDHYEKIEAEKTTVRERLEAIVAVYQDGYVECSLVETLGCAECYRRWCDGQ